jgi:hypothetical protein
VHAVTAFPFGPWLPDQAPLGNQGVIDVRNCLPGPSGYVPFRALVASTGALPSRPLGAAQALDQLGAIYQYAGTASGLYENVAGFWTDRSKSGGYATGQGERWEFVAWKNKMIATNFTDPPQAITFGGVQFADLTSQLKARHVAVVRDFVVFGNTFDPTDGAVPSRVRWSAFNNESDYTVSPVTLSDYQDLRVSKVQRIFGGEYGVVFQADRVWRMTFAGAPVVFQFDQVLDGIGLMAPGAAVQIGDVIIFLSDKGLYRLEQGIRPVPIGIDRFDKTLLDDLDENFLDRISAVADPRSGLAFMAYPGAGNTGGSPNRILAIDPATNRATLIDMEVELIAGFGGSDSTVDQSGLGDTSLDDAVLGDVSVDDPRFSAQSPQLSAFDATFRSGFFDGSELTARIDTAEYAFAEGAHTRLDSFRAIVDGGSVTAQVGTRDGLDADTVYGPVLSPVRANRFALRSNAKYHRFRFFIGGEWRHAIGMQIEPGAARQAEGRD